MAPPLRHRPRDGRLGRPDPTSAEVVAQVIRDLALAWKGPDLVLDLTGPEGGTWLIGMDLDAPVVTLPALEFLRHLSGRVAPEDLLADRCPISGSWPMLGVVRPHVRRRAGRWVDLVSSKQFAFSRL